MKKFTLPLIAVLSLSSAQAATLNIEGTIISTNPSGVPHEGAVTGTFDDVAMALNITVNFLLATTLNGISGTDTSGGVSITVGSGTGATSLTNGDFTTISFASDSTVSGSNTFPFTGTDHVVEGNFVLTAAEAAALTAGNIFVTIDGDDADGVALLVASAVPEPTSSALLSFAGLALLARRRRA